MTNEDAIAYLVDPIGKPITAHEKAVEIAVKSIKKQIPKKPKKDERYTKELCPVCNDFVRLYAGTPMLFCCNCGQALDWSDAE